MSKRVTVCFDGRKILTKIVDGETVQHFLDQINSKHNKSFKHIWLSHSKVEGEIDDLDVLDNGEAIYLTGIARKCISCSPVDFHAETDDATLSSSSSSLSSSNELSVERNGHDNPHLDNDFQMFNLRGSGNVTDPNERTTPPYQRSPIITPQSPQRRAISPPRQQSPPRVSPNNSSGNHHQLVISSEQQLSELKQLYASVGYDFQSSLDARNFANMASSARPANPYDVRQPFGETPQQKLPPNQQGGSNGFIKQQPVPFIRRNSSNNMEQPTHGPLKSSSSLDELGFRTSLSETHATPEDNLLPISPPEGEKKPRRTTVDLGSPSSRKTPAQSSQSATGSRSKSLLSNSTNLLAIPEEAVQEDSSPSTSGVSTNEVCIYHGK